MQLSDYPILRALQLKRDNFFRRIFELLNDRQESQGPLQDLRAALLHKLANGDGQCLDEVEEIVSSSALSLFKQICVGNGTLCALAAKMDGLLSSWRRLLLVRCRPEESIACLEVLKELLLTLQLPELERIWLKHDFGVVLFEILASKCNDEVTMFTLSLITSLYSCLPWQLLSRPLEFGVPAMVKLGRKSASTGNRPASHRWLECIRSLLPFIFTQDLDLVARACSDNFKYNYDAMMLQQTWMTLAKIASNHEHLAACTCFVPDCQGIQDGRESESVLETTFRLIRGCEKSVLMHGQAMMAMLDLISAILNFLTASLAAKQAGSKARAVLLEGLVQDVVLRLMEEYQWLDPAVILKMLALLSTAMERIPEFAAQFAPSACASGFVGTCVRFLQEASAKKEGRKPVVAFMTQLLFATGAIASAEDLHVLNVFSLEEILVECVRNGCSTEHGVVFVDTAAAVLASTLVHDDVPCDEILASTWAVQV